MHLICGIKSSKDGEKQIIFKRSLTFHKKKASHKSLVFTEHFIHKVNVLKSC